VKIRSAVWPTKAAIKKMKKKHRQNITWTHRWACVHNNNYCGENWSDSPTMRWTKCLSMCANI